MQKLTLATRTHGAGVVYLARMCCVYHRVIMYGTEYTLSSPSMMNQPQRYLDPCGPRATQRDIAISRAGKTILNCDNPLLIIGLQVDHMAKQARCQPRSTPAVNRPATKLQAATGNTEKGSEKELKRLKS